MSCDSVQLQLNYVFIIVTWEILVLVISMVWKVDSTMKKIVRTMWRGKNPRPCDVCNIQMLSNDSFSEKSSSHTLGANIDRVKVSVKVKVMWNWRWITWHYTFIILKISRRPSPRGMRMDRLDTVKSLAVWRTEFNLAGTTSSKLYVLAKPWTLQLWSVTFAGLEHPLQQYRRSVQRWF